MKKVFHDAHRWNKKWFRKLGPRGRDIWNWVLDNSEHGIWEVDLEAMAFDLGYEVQLSEIKLIFGCRMHEIGDGKVFLPAAVVFQYGALSEDCNPHKPVLRDLKKHNLIELYQEELIKSSGTLKNKNKDKDQDKRGSGGDLSDKEIYLSLPILTRDRIQKDYDAQFIEEGVKEAVTYHSADPSSPTWRAIRWGKIITSWLAEKKRRADKIQKEKGVDTFSGVAK